MVLQAVDRVVTIGAEDFKEQYYDPMIPLVITGLSKHWPAYKKWDLGLLQIDRRRDQCRRV